MFLSSLLGLNIRFNNKTVLNAFIKTANESNRKTNKLWVDQEILE